LLNHLPPGIGTRVMFGVVVAAVVFIALFDLGLLLNGG
jgi:hypothetical protein